MAEPNVAAADDDLALLKGQFEEWYDGTRSYRANAEKCRDYRNGKQWTDTERKVLEGRGQPVLTDNKIGEKCDTLLGIEERKRTDPKAFPRTPKHEQDAEAATDALRYVADDNDFQRTVRQRCADDLMVEGLAGVEIVIEKYEGDATPKVCQRHIRWDRRFWDVHALLPDFSDKRWCGFFTWMDHEEALEHEEWPREALESYSNESATDDGGTAADKPRYVQNVRKRKRVRIVTHFYKKKGVWMRAVWCSGGMLEKPEKSTYLDERKQPSCPIELQAVYRDRDGDPYGPTSNWLDRQDAINKRESKLLHLLNTKQIIGPEGSFPDDPVTGESGIKKAREELHKPDGVVLYSPGMGDKVEIRDNLQLAEGQWKMLVHSLDSMSSTGPNAALLGQTGSISGLAKQVDQQAGTLPLAPLFGALAALQHRIGRQTWCRIRQFWTAPMWIRVTDDEENIRFVGLNQPITAGEFVAEGLKDNQDLSDDEKAEVLRRLAQDPRSQQQARHPDGRGMVRHAVAEMDVDIIIDEGDDVVTVQQEQFASLVEVAKTRPEVPFEVLLDLSQVRQSIKKRIMDKLSGSDDPRSQQMAALQEQMQQLGMALQAANVRKANAQADQAEAAAEETSTDNIVKTATFIDPPQQPSKTQVSVN